MIGNLTLNNIYQGSIVAKSSSKRYGRREKGCQLNCLSIFAIFYLKLYAKLLYVDVLISSNECMKDDLIESFFLGKASQKTLKCLFCSEMFDFEEYFDCSVGCSLTMWEGRSIPCSVCVGENSRVVCVRKASIKNVSVYWG